ncbi:MAG: M20 family metallopeptidase [Anaerolineae bacterium]|jgi:acetylornithine deacetylase/succinyl-diaminopimelate desuccinylase-like protein|nr:M20 family metallopeptidase [Anaerolineae bacterium]
MSNRLLQAAKARLPEMTAFLQELVRTPSVNGRETERAVARCVAAEAARLNFEAQLVARDPARPNVLVTWGQGPAGFAFIAHTDTVAEGNPAAWRSPPFEAALREGRLYGRGAADNKAGLVCGLYTLALLRDEGLLDPATVHVTVAGVVDEESGASSPLGVRALLDEGVLAGTRGAIYAYTSDIVCIGHRGLLRVILRAEGQSIHSGSTAWSQGLGGINAVTGLAAILLRLETLDLPTPAPPGFEGLRCTLTPGTRISGGEFESVVPAHAEALVDIRLMPGQNPEDVLTAIQRLIAEEVERRPGLRTSLEVKNRLPGATIPMDHPLAVLAQRTTAEVTGATWSIAGAGPANEGYMLIEAGIPTLCGFGPTGDNAHAPDEWVELESLPRTVVMFADIVQKYLQRV